MLPRQRQRQAYRISKGQKKMNGGGLILNRVRSPVIPPCIKTEIKTGTDEM